jgi:hypothetical protein
MTFIQAMTASNLDASEETLEVCPTPFACKSLFLDLNIAKIITLQFLVKHICIFRTRVQTYCSPRGFF